MKQTLYKQASNGKPVEWTIEVQHGAYRTSDGYVGGVITYTEWTQAKSKNVGKSNETSAHEQALLEAKAKIKKKKEKGYTYSLDAVASAKEAAWLEPMLAYPIEKKMKKIQAEGDYIVQPKLDGMRCIGTMDGLFSRNGKPIVSVPHIHDEVKKIIAELIVKLDFPVETIRIDGELYNHDFAKDFNGLISLIRKGDPLPQEQAKLVQYHIYDIDTGGLELSCAYRLSLIERIDVILNPSLRRVPSHLILFNDTPEEVIKGARGWEEKFVEQGYEGAMLRDGRAFYENKRSDSLLKVKSFLEGEFSILEILEGQGNRSGMAGKILVDVKATGKTSEAGIAGGVNYYKWLWANKDSLVGKSATVKYFGFTADGKLRFPVTKSVAREDYE